MQKKIYIQLLNRIDALNLNLMHISFEFHNLITLKKSKFYEKLSPLIKKKIFCKYMGSVLKISE